MIQPWESIVNNVVDDEETPPRLLRKIRSTVEFEIEHIERNNEQSETYKGLKSVMDKINSKCGD